MVQATTIEEPHNKKQVGMKLTSTARQLRQDLSRKLGIDKTAVVEIALRELADRHNLNGNTAKNKQSPPRAGGVF